MLKGNRVSNGVNKEVMSPMDAYMRYAQLEEQHIAYGEKIKSCGDYLLRRSMRKKRKAIRREQNLLYPFIAKGKLIQKLQRSLGLKYETLYKRYKASEFYKKE